MSPEPDPVYRNALREAIYIGLSWIAATTYSCTYCYFFGYQRADRALGVDDIHPVFGMPSWFFWGVMVPWAACAVFTIWFAGMYMADDDLGKDRTQELEADIREGGMS